MKLLGYLTDAAEHEGRPNIMAVGDDDQAIYKFQGAEISNILSFRNRYKDPRIITLTTNYRSRQPILDLARHLIQKGVDRLENRLEGLKKDLIAAGKNLKEGEILSRSFPSSSHEHHWIAQEVRRLLDSGIKGDDIAVIARQHKDLESILPYFAKLNVPIAYERQRNVLLQPHIRQVIQMARYVAAATGTKPKDADVYLPEILSYPFWGIDRKTMWDLSSAASAQHVPWLDAMLQHKDQQIKSVAEFFLELRDRTNYEPAEAIFDALIGSHATLTADSKDEDDDDSDSPVVIRGFVSPFREYYFSKKKYEANKQEYLAFLSALRAFVLSLREYKQGVFIRVHDAVDFIDLHEKNKIAITDQSPFVASSDSVHLLTAHKAKGLEFKVVFVASCQDSTWARTPFGSYLPFPMNLQIAPAGDTVDDQLRLFYVAITRARQWLYMTSYTTTESSKEDARLRFLASGSEEEMADHVREALTVNHIVSENVDATIDIITTQWETYNRPPYVADENALLKKLVENYQMSVTHLNNFLNVKNGGPQNFFEQNLLRFPQAKTVSAIFGSLMHSSLEAFYGEFKGKKSLPPRERLIEIYEQQLSRERLSHGEIKECRTRGEKSLSAYYDQKHDSFKLDDEIEINFKEQGVIVEDVLLGGEIDKLVRVGEGEFKVVDFKTGKVIDRWDNLTDSYEKIKMHNYRRQLVFYKLLIEHSRDFGGKYKVQSGALEFLEPVRGNVVEVSMEIDPEEVARTTALIKVVSEKIQSLDFPDISQYSKDLNGIILFEEDLLARKIESKILATAPHQP